MTLVPSNQTAGQGVRVDSNAVFASSEQDDNYFGGNFGKLTDSLSTSLNVLSDFLNDFSERTTKAPWQVGSGIIAASTTEISISAALSSPSTYPASTLGQALITLVRSVQIDYNNMWFDNNWKIETDYGTRAQLVYYD